MKNHFNYKILQYINLNFISSLLIRLYLNYFMSNNKYLCIVKLLIIINYYS